MRLELTRPNGHYPLKVARLPIPPLLHYFYKSPFYVPRTGLEPARLSTLAPETSASTIPPPGHYTDSSVVDTNSNSWAENETRTRDPNLGKVMLYQLSYFRVCCFTISKIRTTSFRFASAKVQLFIELPNFSQEKMIKKLIFFKNRGLKPLFCPKKAPKYGFIPFFALVVSWKKCSRQWSFLSFFAFYRNFFCKSAQFATFTTQ